MFKRVRHWSLSSVSCIQSTPFHNIFLKSILILSSHLLIVLPNRSHHFRFPNQNTVCISHLSCECYMPRQSHLPWFVHPINILWRAQVVKLLIMQSSSTPHHFLPQRSKYSPQHPVLKHPQRMLILISEILECTRGKEHHQHTFWLLTVTGSWYHKVTLMFHLRN